MISTSFLNNYKIPYVVYSEFLNPYHVDTPHKSDATGTHKVFQQTIMWWKRQMSEMLESIYNIIYTKDITGRIMDRIERRSVKPNKSEVYLLSRQMKVNISFPVTPFISNEELYNLYLQGVVQWEQYVTCVSRNTGIPIDNSARTSQTFNEQ